MKWHCGGQIYNCSQLHTHQIYNNCFAAAVPRQSEADPRLALTLASFHVCRRSIRTLHVPFSVRASTWPASSSTTTMSAKASLLKSLSGERRPGSVPPSSHPGRPESRVVSDHPRSLSIQHSRSLSLQHRQQSSILKHSASDLQSSTPNSSLDLMGHLLRSESCVVKTRTGSVLSRGFILKTDHYPSGLHCCFTIEPYSYPSIGRALDLDLNVHGAPNFRSPRQGGLNVFGAAQPRTQGLRAILSILRCRPNTADPTHVVWFSTREEPIGMSYIHHAHHPRAPHEVSAGMNNRGRLDFAVSSRPRNCLFFFALFVVVHMLIICIPSLSLISLYLWSSICATRRI